eukprot:383336_1
MPPFRYSLLKDFHCGLLLLLIICVNSIVIKPVGEWEIVWHYSERCANKSTPDVSARAFKLNNNNIEFLDGDNYGFYQMRGPNFNNLTPICNKTVINAGNSGPYALPSEYNNSIFIYAVWREENNPDIVHGLIHNEFHGEKQLNSSICPSKETKNCWYSNTLCGVSTDSGNTFQVYDDVNKRACIVTPFLYIPDAGRQGMPGGTNILYNPINDGYHYVWLHANLLPNGYDIGMCLWRSNNLSDPNAWRGWNGTANGFNVYSVDPYSQENNNSFNPHQHVCQISDTLDPHFQWSWTFNTITNSYIHIGLNQTSGYILYTYSKNLFHWAEPVELMPLNFTGDGHKIAYPSLIDETSSGVNFEYTNQNPWLYLSRWNSTQGNARDIIRIKLQISPSI